MGARKAPFSQGVLVAFRERLIAHDLDRRLVDRTVALAKARGGLAGSRCARRSIRRRCSGRAASKTRGKRHVLTWIDTDVILEALVRPANEPEHATLAAVTPALAAHGALEELFIDRGYLASPAVPCCTLTRPLARVSMRFAPLRQPPIREG